jgi:hypothetical protein
MHKKKNPLRVLSGELVLNFRKASAVVSRPCPVQKRSAAAVVQECCERMIVRHGGASTEALHHEVVPKLLETGLLGRFSRECGDITPELERHFEFDEADGKWHLPEGHQPTGQPASNGPRTVDTRGAKSRSPAEAGYSGEKPEVGRGSVSAPN